MRWHVLVLLLLDAIGDTDIISMLPTLDTVYYSSPPPLFSSLIAIELDLVCLDLLVHSGSIRLFALLRFRLRRLQSPGRQSIRNPPDSTRLDQHSALSQPHAERLHLR